ncbi:uncharacterized protein LOC119693658 [Plutella xylostella]|uniref:uncharacterized protein LOC119693658 n=1 Tax=Plutella xylostella TaxID=51655 RepID=UPI0020331B7E|nr:uncharacterized protein LOC119693658 [Plutella xylostella]
MINALIEDTRIMYLRQGEVLKNDIFEINGQQIIPLFDTPHLIKGIRNNLMTKNLKCQIDEKIKIAKWEHIIKLHQENPAYKGIKLIKNLTEAHVDPKKLRKMKVKMATQVFSKTVGTNMGYLADKGILPIECKDTADILLFFDELFDSLNGSYDNSKKRCGKILLKAVTPKSEHSKVWARAKKVLKTMKFVTNQGREGSVPSITNWLRTLNNVELLKNQLIDEHKIKSIWMRHFNQDPLENFFGCIRSHGCRNISPTALGFESAFTSLLINNLNSNHSVGSNCQEDKCRIFQSMKSLLNKEDVKENNITEVDMCDIECKIEDFREKASNTVIFSQLSYVAGYILKRAKNIYKNYVFRKAFYLKCGKQPTLFPFIKMVANTV